MKNRSTLYSTAIHEAGHAAAHLWFQIPFSYVTIIPKDMSAGHLMPNENKRFREIMEVDAPTATEERFIKHNLILLMAGGTAQGKYLKIKTIPEGASQDVHQLIEICVMLGMRETLINSYSKYIIEESKTLISQDNIWEFITALADELIQKQTLSYSQCKKLYKANLNLLHFDKGSKTRNVRPITWTSSKVIKVK